MSTSINHPTATNASVHAPSPWAVNLFAALTLAGIVSALLLLWPIPYLGYFTEPATGLVVEVVDDTTAARAGLRRGDRVVHRYDYAWEDVGTQWFVFPLHWSTVESIPLWIERDGDILQLTLPAEPPTLAYQIEKLSAFGLGLICWLTGALLGLAHRRIPSHLARVAWFWLATGGIAGFYTFAYYSSYPLSLVAQWLLMTIFAPVAVYIHVWFPPRPVNEAQRKTARRALAITLVLMQIATLTGIAVWQPTITALVVALGTIMPAMLGLAFLATGVLLWRARRQTSILHTRRQIQLIASACFIVASTWIVLRTIPNVLDQFPILPHYVLDLFAAFVPLAYVAGGLLPDLYRLDKVIGQLTLHALTIAMLALLITGGALLISVPETGTTLWAALCVVTLYRPLQRGMQWIADRSTQPEAMADTLALTTQQLAGTLDTNAQAAILVDGLQRAFGSPPIALYLRQSQESDELAAVVQRQIDLPPILELGTLTSLLPQATAVVETHDIDRRLKNSSLNAGEQQFMYHPQIVLWCPLSHQGALLGLLLLGQRPDLDPYRATDIRELQRTMSAATLAITNGNSYTRLSKAEQTIRQLYRRVKQAQDRTTTAIARELHSEVINITIRLNIESLDRIIAIAHEPQIRQGLQEVRAGQEQIGYALRSICRRLSPSGSDDPFGLPGMLERHIEHIEHTWHGDCRLKIHHTACAVAPEIQREALSIVREAMTNAIKHSGGSEIDVELYYPAKPDDPVRIVVRDNGTGIGNRARNTSGLGLQQMIEGARTVGGELKLARAAGGGAEVVFTFPTTVPSQLMETPPYEHQTAESS